MREGPLRWFHSALVHRFAPRWLIVFAMLAGVTACEGEGAVERLVAEGVTLAQAGETAAALERFDKSLAIEPGHPAALVNGGLAALLEGRPLQAKERLERYLAGNDSDVLPRVYLAHALLALGDREGAIAALQHAVRLGFNDLDVLVDGSLGALRHDLRFVQLANLVAQRTGRRAPVDDRGRPLFGDTPIRSLSVPGLDRACASPVEEE